MILGANGFIGSALTNAILRTTPWEVFGIDLADNKLGDLPKNSSRFHFVEGDITINKEWVEYHVKKCDAVVPLVAIANPAQYVTHPLRVFELDFEANLAIEPARLRTDQQTALDLCGLEADARSRYLRLRRP
jgi:nucleoside-diphosphate-sugar epimerase